MKKLLTYLLAALLVSTAVFAASVTRNMPQRLDPNAVLTVSFSINGATPNEVFAIEDKVPDGWTIADFSVTGAKEAKSEITARTTGSRYGWSFTPSGESATLSYTIQAPATEGSYTFDAIWFDRSGQSRSTQVLQIRAIRCGDGICEGAENTGNCAADCPATVTTTAIPPEFTTTSIQVEQAEKKNTTTLWIIVGVLILLLLVYFLLKKKHESTELPKV